MRVVALGRSALSVPMLLTLLWLAVAPAGAGIPPTPSVVPTPATPIPCGAAVPPLCAGGDCGGGISSCQPDPFGSFCVCEPPTPSPAEPTPTPGRDAFTCYRSFVTRRTVKLPGIPNPPGVSLVDRFGSSTVEVKRSVGLCAPTDPNGERPGAELHADHLKHYPIKNAVVPKPVFPTRMRVVDRFNPGGQLLDLTGQSHLLVPAAKSLELPPPEPSAPTIDHLECYEVSPSARAPKFVPVRRFPVEDQFGPLTLDVRKPKHLCHPVDKNGEGVRDPDGHLLCYRARQVDRVRFAKRSPVFVHDQLGPETLDVTRPVQLCVPASVDTVLATDLVGTFDYQSARSALAVIEELPSGLRLTIEFEPGDYIQGPLELQSDGSVSVSGFAVADGDIFLGAASVIGTATLVGGTTLQIVGAVTSALPGGSGGFSMSRPLAGTPSALGGPYVLTIVGLSDGVSESKATLVLSIPKTGIGESTESANETAADGAVLGTFAPGGCLVSPLGKVSCRLPYVHQIPPPPAFPLPAFTAQIAGDLATGGTVFGDTPPIPHAFPIATWTVH